MTTDGLVVVYSPAALCASPGEAARWLVDVVARRLGGDVASAVSAHAGPAGILVVVPPARLDQVGRVLAEHVHVAAFATNALVVSDEQTGAFVPSSDVGAFNRRVAERLCRRFPPTRFVGSAVRVSWSGGPPVGQVAAAVRGWFPTLLGGGVPLVGWFGRSASWEQVAQWTVELAGEVLRSADVAHLPVSPAGTGARLLAAVARIRGDLSVAGPDAPLVEKVDRCAVALGELGLRR